MRLAPGASTPQSARSKFIAAAPPAPPPRRDIMLNDVRIEDGTVRIIYDDNGTERRIEHIDAALSLPHLIDPLTAKGDFDWKGMRVGFDLTLTSPADLESARQGSSLRSTPMPSMPPSMARSRRKPASPPKAT